MRENRPSGSEGGGAELNRPSLPLSVCACGGIITKAARKSAPQAEVVLAETPQTSSRGA